MYFLEDFFGIIITMVLASIIPAIVLYLVIKIAVRDAIIELKNNNIL